MSQYNVYEHTNEIFDSSTGEITKATKFSTKKISNQEKDRDYIRVYKYLNTVFAFKDIPLSCVPALIEISKYMTYAEKGQQVVFHKIMKAEICSSLEIKEDRLNKIISILKEHDVLRPTLARGVYAVNPFIIGCGSTTEINELRAQFDYAADTLTTQYSQTNFITGKEVKRIVQEVKKNTSKLSQIPGQISIFSTNEEE